jgi:hypothetical protein
MLAPVTFWTVPSEDLEPHTEQHLPMQGSIGSIGLTKVVILYMKNPDIRLIHPSIC